MKARKNVRPILLTLLGGAGLLLVIACANVASLVLVRSESRRREVPVRGALGATRGRLARQFAVEGLLMAGAGGLSGTMIAAALMRLLGKLVPKHLAANMPFLDGVNLNMHTAVFASAVIADKYFRQRNHLCRQIPSLIRVLLMQLLLNRRHLGLRCLRTNPISKPAHTEKVKEVPRLFVGLNVLIGVQKSPFPASANEKLRCRTPRIVYAVLSRETVCPTTSLRPPMGCSNRYN